MPAPVIPIQPNAVVELIFWSNLAGQKILNTFQYKMASPPPVDLDYRLELNNIADKIQEAGGMQDKYVAACPTNQNIERFTLQPIWPIRQRYLSYNVTLPGGATTGSTNTANLAASIKRVGDVIGRRGVGRVQIPATKNGVVAGIVDPTYIAADLIGLADQMVLGFSTSTPIEWQPVLFGVTGGIAHTAVVIDTEVESTARTMHRRTVGLGI